MQTITVWWKHVLIWVIINDSLCTVRSNQTIKLQIAGLCWRYLLCYASSDEWEGSEETLNREERLTINKTIPFQGFKNFNRNSFSKFNLTDQIERERERARVPVGEGKEDRGFAWTKEAESSLCAYCVINSTVSEVIITILILSFYRLMIFQISV